MQLAKMMGVSQQTIASWEVGRRGMPVSALPALTRALSVCVETLIGGKTQPVKRSPSPKPQQQVKRLVRLPKVQQRVVMQMLEGVLVQASR